MREMGWRVLDGVFGALEGGVMCGVGVGWRVCRVLEGV